LSTSPIPEYLKQIEKTFGAGNATEHSYRPALKSLIEALADQMSATNEPKRERCGAPDLFTPCQKKINPLLIRGPADIQYGCRLDKL